MDVFGVYVSGILYGELELCPGAARIRRLDVFSGSLQGWEPLTDEINAFYKAFTKLDLAAFAANEPLYSEGLRGKGEVRLAGERYTSEDGVHYLQRDVKFPANKQMDGDKLAAVYCPAREMVTLVVRQGWEDKTLLRQWREAWPDETLWPVARPVSVEMPMRDGVRLAADVYLPAGCSQKLPAVLVRTPYGKEDGCEVYYRYVQRGYAVVVQDVRGRSKSGGDWIPNYYEVEDGDDTLNWIAAQPWSSGSVGMVGGSYLGYVQWAAAASGNPHLKAMISVVCAGSAFVDLPRRGGSLTSGMLAWAFAVSQKEFRPELMERDDWDEVLRIRPLAQLPQKALGYPVPFLERWFEPSDYSAFWQRSNWKERSCGAQVPALIQSGWFDDNGMGTTEALELVHDYPAGLRKVILGPWQHSGNSRYDLHALSFGSEALRFDLDLLYFRWFEHFLKGVDNGVDRTPPVEYYTVGQERWKTAENWPVPAARECSLYLDSDGGANTSEGDGRLVWQAPAREGADRYIYDPRDPATHIIDLSENELEVPEDYTEEERRGDMLCYTTAPLTEDLTLTGDMTAELYVSSNAPDTDFIVRVTDLDEAGRSVKLADGILSARYRSGFEKAEFLTPKQVVCLKIRTTKLSNCFKKGHCIRLTVTSGAKNFVFPNSNTFGGYNTNEVFVAQNQVHHGGAYASRLIVRAET